LHQVLEVFELLDSKYINGQKIADFLKGKGLEKIEVQRIGENTGSTDFIKIIVPGTNGKQKGGEAPTLGIIGRLGGIGARPERIGIVSDADGAVAAISCALKLADMQKNGDILNGDVILSTQICPNAPTQPHKPVPFMGSPVDMGVMNKYEVDLNMDAILSIDATKGNRIINFRGFAITPTIKEGYILRISEDLLNIMEWTTVVPPLSNIFPFSKAFFTISSSISIISCADDPGVKELRKLLKIPVIGAGSSVAALSLSYGDKVGTFGITEQAPPIMREILGKHLVAETKPEGIKTTLDLMTNEGKRNAFKSIKYLKEKGAEVIALACT
ncbi:unnamed protein product, partial [marine sediment metagenome]